MSEQPGSGPGWGSQQGGQGGYGQETGSSGWQGYGQGYPGQQQQAAGYGQQSYPPPQQQQAQGYGQGYPQQQGYSPYPGYPRQRGAGGGNEAVTNMLRFIVAAIGILSFFVLMLPFQSTSTGFGNTASNNGVEIGSIVLATFALAGAGIYALLQALRYVKPGPGGNLVLLGIDTSMLILALAFIVSGGFREGITRSAGTWIFLVVCLVEAALTAVIFIMSPRTPGAASR